jgi:hypothetical protein
VNDTNHDEEDDRMDETWVCYDRQLIDDELYDLWAKFKPACGSSFSPIAAIAAPSYATSRFHFGWRRIRAMPTSVVKQVQKAHAKMYRKIQTNILRQRAQGWGERAADIRLHGQSDVARRSAERTVHGHPQESVERRQVRRQLSQVSRRHRVDDAKDQTPNYYFVGLRESEVRSATALRRLSESFAERAGSRS